MLILTRRFLGWPDAMARLLLGEKSNQIMVGQNGHST